MIILVDYDNLPRIDRQRGPSHFVPRLLDKIGPARLTTPRARVKLYGGWFDRNQLSNRALNLSATTRASFPTAITVTDGTSSVTPLVRVDMGFSLEIDPMLRLENTFRRRGMPTGLQCSPPPVPNCANHMNCPIRHLHALVTSEQCSDSRCQVGLGDVLSRHE